MENTSFENSNVVHSCHKSSNSSSNSRSNSRSNSNSSSNSSIDNYHQNDFNDSGESEEYHRLKNMDLKDWNEPYLVCDTNLKRVNGVLADIYRLKGNDLFNASKFREAISVYTKGIEFDETNVLLYSNRSAAYLGLEDYENVVLDSQRSLELDRNWIKVCVI